MEAIKISDLSIGDWVRYRDREWIVCSLYQFTEEVGLWRKDSQLCEYVADIEPIHLTPEILEKNGFRKLDRFNEYVIGEWDSNPFIAVRLAEKFVEPTILVKNGGTSAHLFGPLGENVHQLQHALRSAGVGKEIEV